MSRRSFLRFTGAGAAGMALSHQLGPLYAAVSHPDARRFMGHWDKVPYPVPLPGDAGSAAGDAMRLATFEVVDDLVLPPGFRYDVLARWGDRFGPEDQPEHQIVFGYNADYVALLPADKPDEFYLLVNHEYISPTPWLQGLEEVRGEKLHQNGRIDDFVLAGGTFNVDEAPSGQLEVARGVRRLCRAALSDLGVSIVRVRRRAGGGYEVLKDATDHRRIHGFGRVNVPDHIPLVMTGPVAKMSITTRGTYANCSGGTTPWGTALTCEENFQDQLSEDITPSGRVVPGSNPVFSCSESMGGAGLPFYINGLGSGLAPVPDPRGYGWVCEVDPATGAMWKHSALGRFRHENVAVRAEAGKRLAAYMGDDRRGGHVWKYVSRDVVGDPADRHNGRLFTEGVLYAARMAGDFSGRWIPIAPETPLVVPQPERCAGGFMWLPDRPGGGKVAVGEHPKIATITPEAWMDRMVAYAGKPFAELRLGDLCAAFADPQAVILLDAYLMANAAGATPCARPEDVEVHPGDGSIYVAFTDSTGSGDGSPDADVFPDSRGENSRQYGAIYRLAEAGNEPDATTFAWGKFVASGEAAEGGGGFACADNLAFDPRGDLWMVTDISTTVHNFPVNRDEVSAAGTGKFPGVFGNNALFRIPTSGEDAGVLACFATGPMECELTGPFMTDDGCILIAVQHPGEMFGARSRPDVRQPDAIREREITIIGRDGQPFTQKRFVPLGSNFPANRPGEVPRPCVVCIRRV